MPLIEEGGDEARRARVGRARARPSACATLLAPLRVGHGPRPDEAGRPRRRDDPLPRRRARRPRRHDRRRGRRRRAGGDDDGHRGRRPVRARPAPPAPRPGRARHASSRSASSSPTRPTRRRRPGSRRSPRSHDGFELAEQDFELRREGDVLGLAQSGLPRLRVASLQAPSIATWRSAPARTPRRCSTPTGRHGAAAAGARRRARERLAPARRGRRAGERRMTGATVADAGRVIAGTARGIRLEAPGRRHAAARRPRQADAVRDPRAGPARMPASSTCSPAAARPGSRRCRAARRTRRSSSATAGAAAVIAANLGRTRPRRAERARIVRADVARAGSAGPEAAAAGPFDVVIVDPPYADDRAARGRARGASGRTLAPGARVVAKHFWRDPPPASGRAASIRARAPLRRDDADLLPTRGGADEHGRGLPRLVRPDHQRPPRRHRPGRGRLRPRRRRRSSRTRASRRCSTSTTRIRVIREAARGDGRRAADRIEVESFDGLTVDFCRARVAPAPSSAACARSATSRPRCSSPTTTGCSRPTSTRSSS